MTSNTVNALNALDDFIGDLKFGHLSPDAFRVLDVTDAGDGRYTARVEVIKLLDGDTFQSELWVETWNYHAGGGWHRP